MIRQLIYFAILLFVANNLFCQTETYKVKHKGTDVFGNSIYEVEKKEGLPTSDYYERRSVNQGAYANPRGIRKYADVESENQDAELERLQYEKNQAKFFEESSASWEALEMEIISKHRTKLLENALMYSLEPSVEVAFEIAKSSKILFQYGKMDDRFGHINTEHKLLVIKYKGRYKKYLKENK